MVSRGVEQTTGGSGEMWPGCLLGYRQSQSIVVIKHRGSNTGQQAPGSVRRRQQARLWNTKAHEQCPALEKEE